MPELPEVETVRQTLRNQILNEEIKEVKVYYAPIIENVSEDCFCKDLCNEKLTDIKRYGKYLIFIFTNYSIIAHLRMEGKFFLKSLDEPKEKHEHIFFIFKSGLTLRYHDTRKFGKMALIHSTNIDEIMEYPALKKLGPEANSLDLKPEYLYNNLIKRNETIKTALLNQEIISGLGNIYVDEVCFLCRLNPKMSCHLITMDDANRIIKACQDVLTKAIAKGGTTIRSYTSSLGVTGRFQLELNVHTKVGCACPVCGSTIIKTVVGGRGTYLCPHCQKNNRVKVIGLTGGIASGKSTVKKYLESLNYVVVDSDSIVSKLYLDKTVIESIRNIFGDNCIVDNQISRKELGLIVYHNDILRQKLNDLIHPLVKREIEKAIRNNKQSLIFIDVPLLFEAHFDNLCDEIIVVYVDLKTNIERLMHRDNIDYNYALDKINSQMRLEEKCQKANYIIDNSHDLCYTYKQTNEILKKING